jgi:glycosyltransferase involved in cell wall biosynthesis
MVAHSFPGKVKALAQSLASGIPYSVLLFQNERFGRAISNIVAREAFDVVHMETALLYQYAEHLRGLPVVVRHHNLEGELLAQQAHSASNPLRKAVLHWQATSLKKYENLVQSKANASVAITGVDRDLILTKNTLNTPVLVIPSGIDAPETVPDPATEHCIVFSGRMDWAPNAEAAAWLASQVFPRIRQAFPRITLYIVGGNPGASTRALAGNGIVVTGFVESVQEYLDKAEVCVVPLLSGSGMRLKILQAMARGKAIVSTTKGAEGIDCRHRQDIILADRPEEFAEAVVMLLGDPSQRRTLGATAFSNVKRKYSWDAVGSQFVECYRAAASRACKIEARPNA